ncbi:MAG: hypothetical protein K2K75_07440 [Muribaculaceae bacterium]|nr:hypothetical protein [Muribaculaceae bacterium]
MKKLKFKCTLLSDVILNMKSATTGPNETLDFIPGSNFLGIVAAALYPTATSEEALLLFHSGKVRFGDAHPSQSGIRGLRVPAAMYYPKLSSPEKELYIHHLIPKEKDMTGLQLKQCRNGFYVFPVINGLDSKAPVAKQVRTYTDFAIKSAYDRQQRRSKDEQLFGYQSLRKGLAMYFSVEFDDSASSLMDNVREALEKGDRIGRSRSAQYGHVKIEHLPEGYLEEEGGRPLYGDLKGYVAVYADSRLIFLDEYGMPTFQPTAGQLGLKGEIDWEKSQVRTFRYAPWNFKRQCFDTDRCGIEKGSVLVVRLPEGYTPDLHSRAVGAYLNEGFGQVIYNPSFLSGDKDGKALCRLVTDSKDVNLNKPSSCDSVSGTLLSYLKSRKQEDDGYEKIYTVVNSWVRDNANKFQQGAFASQWGNIRSMATSAVSFEELVEDLLGSDEKDTSAYLRHGVAKKKWEGKRIKAFEKFVKELMTDKSLTDAMSRLAIVNLASEMGKK